MKIEIPDDCAAYVIYQTSEENDTAIALTRIRIMLPQSEVLGLLRQATLIEEHNYIQEYILGDKIKHDNKLKELIEGLATKKNLTTES